MAPRKTYSRTVSANEAEAKDRAPTITGAPKRLTRSCLTRVKDLSPANATSSGDELDAQVNPRQIKRANAGNDDDEEVLDEIVVYATPRQKTNSIKGSPDDLKNALQSQVMSNSGVETPAQSRRRSSRASSVSKSESTGKTPTRIGTPIKKQEFVMAAAADHDEEEDELAAEEPTHKKLKVVPKSMQLAAFRKGRSKWDNSDEMLTNQNSPLVKTKLREILCSTKAWDILTREEKEEILTKFPDEAEILDPGTPNARPNIAALRNNNNFRHDVARYQDGLSRGFHDQEWIKQAQAAHRSRQLGFYDEFMAADFEERWDMPMPEQSQSEPATNGKGSHNADSASKGPVNSSRNETGLIIQSKDMAAQSNGIDDTLQSHPADAAPEKSIDADMRGKRKSLERTNDNEVASVAKVFETEKKGDDQSPERNAKRRRVSAEAEAATTQTSSELSGQQLKISSTNITIPNGSSLPYMMEGVEHHSEEAKAGTTETTEIKQVNAVEEVAKPKSMNSETIVESTQITKDIANHVQQQQKEDENNNVQEESNTGGQQQPPPDDKQGIQSGTAPTTAPTTISSEHLNLPSPAS